MLNLVSTNDLIQIITGSAVNTIWVAAEFEDHGTVITPPQKQQTAITTATTTTVVSSPSTVTQAGDGLIRVVKSLVIYNSSGSSCAITIQLVNNVPSTTTLFSYTLLAGETIVYGEEQFTVVSAAGTVKSTQVLGNQSANTVFAGPTSGSPAPPTFRALVVADIPGGTGNPTLAVMLAKFIA